MSAAPYRFDPPSEAVDGLRILVDGRRPRSRRIVKAQTEDGLVDCEIVASDGFFAVAKLPDGRLIVIGQLPRGRK
jgi:hypothetical protein